MIDPNKPVQCCLCPKKWDKFDTGNVIIHNRDDHQSLLLFLSDDELLLFVKQV